MTWAAAVLAIPGAASALGLWRLPISLAVCLHLLLVATVGLAAHGRLAADRPGTDRLTDFYLLVSVGGALGGLLGGLLAPVVLDRPLEYPLVLALVPALVAGRRRSTEPASRFAAVLAGLVVTALVVIGSAAVAPSPTTLTAAGVAGFCVLVALLVRRPTWVTPLLVATVAVSVLDPRGVLLRDRTFFGSYRVTEGGDQITLQHGTTVRGWQLLDDENGSVPTSYYARSGPLGDVFADDEGLGRVAVVGLGAGTVASYGRDGQRMDLYEIDPAVVAIAQDERYFTYLAGSDADLHVVVGDGRLGLADAPTGVYDLIVLDAFSSDAIPVHLLTREALATYRDRLGSGGMLAVHVTNRHLDLRPVLAAAGRDLGMAVVERRDAEPEEPATASTWVVLAPVASSVDRLMERPGWEWTEADGSRAWTDDYSSIVDVLDISSR